MDNLETDYLVVGAGAMGMAFVDALLDETDADIVIADREHAPGGHWNDAYPFVRLHQPSAFYGVASTPLGSGRIDDGGTNAGLFELATGAEVRAHFEKAMRERFLPSGRVRYLPMHEVLGDGLAVSRVSDRETRIAARKRVVDATYLGTKIPATHERPFEVEDGVACVPPNDLPRAAPLFRSFAILGAGKTGMDAASWLLDVGVDPGAITWVAPRDSWLYDRRGTQPGAAFFEDVFGRTAAQFEACAVAASVDDLFLRLEQHGVVHRIFEDRIPRMCHFATLSRAEAAALRRIRNVVRLGRVARIEPGRMRLEHGDAEVARETLFVDCTAAAVFRRPPVPVFQERKITLQMIRLPQPTFSAALIARIEAAFETDQERNALATPAPLSDGVEEWPAGQVVNMTNQFLWSQRPELKSWILNCRLDGFGKFARGIAEEETDKRAILQRIRDAAFPAVENLQRLAAAGA